MFWLIFMFLDILDHFMVNNENKLFLTLEIFWTKFFDEETETNLFAYFHVLRHFRPFIEVLYLAL